MAIRSHVQNSKFIIKKFKKNSSCGNVRALEISSGIIDDKGPMEVGTIVDYYDENTERFLCDNYESPVGRVADTLVKYDASPSDITVTAKDIDNIKKFLTMLFVRRPAYIQEAYDKTTIAKALGAMPTSSDFVRLLEKTNLVSDFFDHLFIVIIFNHSPNRKTFVSSVKGFSVIGASIQEANWWLPISPTVGINFVSLQCFNEVYHGHRTVNIEEDKMVEYLNDRIAKAAIDDSDAFIFSNKDDELIRIKTQFSL